MPFAISRLQLALVGAIVALTIAARPAGAVLVLPTELVGKQALQVRPSVVDFTGDGSGYLGGFTGHRSFRRGPRATLKWVGRLRWSKWTPADGIGSGAIWLDDGIPDEARGTFHPYAVTVHVFRPRNGVFTRLAFSYWVGDWPSATVRSAHYYPATQYGPGYWQWF
jgi:hypothetical protein